MSDTNIADELVSNHAKVNVGKRSIKNKDDMGRVILSAMRLIQRKIDLIKNGLGRLRPSTRE